ncbi:MAG: xylose isomerase [Planctomycetes bacterium]|nr:xylose isomerase [Planctomycetota bacterium]
MTKFFPEVLGPVPFEGPSSDNPLAFRYYDAKRKVRGRTMESQLKFSVAYWHSLRGTGADPFGGPVYDRPWCRGGDPMEDAERTLDAAFELLTKLGVKRYCFHDRDLAPEGATIEESNRNLDHMVQRAAALQRHSGVKLLWGTANLFSHPRYTHGAATNPDPLVFAHAAAQVRRALDATVALGGTGYVFWGGREGYSSLLNTDMDQERRQLAALLRMTVEYGRQVGFTGAFFIEPKPMEPSTHQYDFDAATTLGFLREFELLDDFSLNIEANHATLAGHSFQHELAVAAGASKLGSLDINRGDPTLGWDTDQFPLDLHAATMAMLVVLGQGGLKHGGLNFDAKLRRGSSDTVDLFHAHIGGMDTFARALLVADAMLKDGVLKRPLKRRYAAYGRGMGKEILQGQASLPELEQWAQDMGEPQVRSGRQEALENVVNDYIYSSKIR